MKPTRLHAEVRRRLRERADPPVRAGAERFFKYVVRFIGVKTAGLRAVSGAVWPSLRTRPPTEIIREACLMLRSPFMEERQVGVDLLWRARRVLPTTVLHSLEPVFDEVVRDWGTCDAISARVLRPLLRREPRIVERLVAWSQAANPWRQRAAAVAFVTEARHGRHDRDILRICGNLVRTSHRFTQLGMGWVLRELSLADHDAVLGFLGDRYWMINREALNYAVEKLPERTRRAVLRAHAAARESTKAHEPSLRGGSSGRSGQLPRQDSNLRPAD